MHNSRSSTVQSIAAQSAESRSAEVQYTAAPPKQPTTHTTHTKEECLVIGKQIYDGEINQSEAAVLYDISQYTARDYYRLGL